jgi:Fe-S-cluster-containing dehydrogenase component
MSCTRRSFLVAAGSVAMAASMAPRLLLAATGRRRLSLRVDLALCGGQPGCQACRTACHAVHNVPDIPDSAKEVKWIWKETFSNVFPDEVYPGMSETGRQAPLPVLCNHCDDPPCVRVCPVGATFARPDGIVVIDEHRCIGCRYCMAACPYGARSFNFQDPRPFITKIDLGYPTRTRGVVEKCTFCVERLGKGLPPACVQACPVSAITFGDVSEIANAASPPSLASRRVLRRKPELGTSPHVFYLL